MVDIIIRAKNGHDYTDRCVRSIRDNTGFVPYRIILVDDGSDVPYTSEMVDVLVRSNESRGAVTATNLGLSIALQRPERPYIVILDNDTRIPDGDTTWLQRFIDELECNGLSTAAVGATSNFANPPQHIMTVPQTYTADWTDEGTGKSGKKENPEAPWFVSCAVMLRKSVIAQLGLWDERYDPGNYEDTDYAQTLRTAGYQVRVARSVYIHHDGHKTFSDKLKGLLETNSQKFYTKWGLGRLMDLGVIPVETMRRILQ